MTGLRSAMYDYFCRGNPFLKGAGHNLGRAQSQPPSFSELLPWLDVDTDGHVLLDDAKSVAAVLELYPSPAEGKSEAFLDELHIALKRMLLEAFPGKDDYPWVIQVFSFRDQEALHTDWQEATERCKPVSDAFEGSAGMRAVFDKHITRLVSQERVFDDPLDGGRAWRCGRQRVLCCVYRYYPFANQCERVAELDKQIKRLKHYLDSADIRHRLFSDIEVCTWLQRWFDPTLSACSSEDLAARKRSFDYNLSDVVCPRAVRSDAERGVWHFGERLCRTLCVQRVRMPPKVGQLSLGNMVGNKTSSLIEQLSPHAVVVMTVVFTTSEWVDEHLDRIEVASVGVSASAVQSRAAATEARHHMLSGGKFYPFSLAVYLAAHSEEDLAAQCGAADALFLENNVQLLRHCDDPVALDSYLRHLPMGYRYSLEQVKYRSQMIYVKDAASLLPLYGRATGSSRLGLSFLNRGGSLLSYNPLDLRDRSKNAHLFLFGPTGSGKSATLTYLQMLMMSCHRPRVVVVEAGNSYGLLTQYFASQGMTVRDEVLRPGGDTRLAPFANVRHLRTHGAQDKSGVLQRDWLGEMTLIARLMITGGRQKEEEAFSRADEAAIARAILKATECSAEHVRVSHVYEALRNQVRSAEAHRRTRIRDMSEALSLFTMGFAGELFDRDGAEWRPADYVRLDLGTLAGSEYKDMLSVIWLGLMNAVLAFAERTQEDGRPIIFLTDEAHVITSNPLLASYVVKISKLLGRRLGLWLWMATQNLSDFHGESQKMLEMFEWWIALGLGGADIEALSFYKPLHKNAYELLANTRKVSGQYTEGVILRDKVVERFRHVPPALCLALAQTEKEEKTYRREVMRRFSCSELEAVFKIEAELLQNVGGSS